MRVLFLTLYPDAAASPRYRVLQYLPYLRGQNIQCDVQPAVSREVWHRFNESGTPPRARWYHLHEFRRRMNQIPTSNTYDIVVLQKAIMTAYVWGLDRLLRVRARRLLYDLDDAMHLSPPSPLHGPWRAIQDLGQAQRLMRMADATLAGNQWLKDRANDAGGRGIHFPTVVDTERFQPPGEAPEGFTVGWIGNSSTARNLPMVWPVLKGLERANVFLVGADQARLPKGAEAFEVKPWTLSEEVKDLQRMSVGIMPLERRAWNRGKCALKALQYMACGIPCVASPFGAVTEIIEHNENGLLCDTEADWRAALEQLRDPAERKRLGDAGRQTVTDRFSLARAQPKFVNILEQYR
jgi:glycosyltransferase involved in cell wall biosynthesis